MNGLSWTLYLADVLPGIGQLMALMFVFVIFSTVTAIAASLIPDTPKNAAKLLWGISAALTLIALIGALIPSRETFLMIAASEAGEAVVTSEEGAQAIEDIQAIITSELGKLSGRITE